MRRRHSNWQRFKQHPLNYLMSSLLRLMMMLAQGAKTSRAGFVLPTTVMLLLVVSLTMGALSFRSFSRVEKTIAFRDQQIIDGYAAPAIDRAKAKLEYLFTQDDRVAGKRPPSSDDLFGALTADIAAGSVNPDDDPYTLPDEIPIDFDGNGTLDDPAWEFDFEGTTVVYSLLVSHERDPGSGVVNLSDDDTQAKADALVTRNAPISTATPNASCPVSRLSGEGWQDAGGNLQKNFQVNVLAIGGSGGPNRTVSASEYQQVRSSPKGNKYGAYFRYDMDVSPGDPFRWNGAMHSESNIVAGRNLEAYLISSPESCVYSLENSEITISEEADGPDANNEPDGYQGNLAYGLVRDNEFGAAAQRDVNFHNNVVVNGNNVNVQKQALDEDNDSVDPLNDNELDKVYADPVKIFTEDVTEALDPAGFDFVDPDVDTEFVGGRVKNFAETDRPILDDGYRADNRFGPKPRYDDETNSDLVALGVTNGDDIPAGRTDLNALDPGTGSYGLDGYWERRAIGEGLRVIVGQRLELGNRFGWSGSNDPLYPPENVAPLENSDSDVVKGASEAKQQRTLRDNLAAVQSMVAYHYTEFDGDLPFMCMASTVHPGTDETLINSRTFSGDIENNFLTGDGTNGWEFNFQSEYGTSAIFADAVRPKRSLGRALRNLALFAGDPWGGAPSFPPVQGIENNAPGATLALDNEFVHPYPYLSMWGDFSVLRRVLFTYNEGNGENAQNISNVAAYEALSPADKSVLHSAACTLGMLANNIEKLEIRYNAIQSTPALLTRIENALGTVTDGEQAQKWLDELAASTLVAADLENAQTLALYRQVVRDRYLGFETGLRPTDCETDFDISLYPKLVDAFCSTAQAPAYPSLYYLFPYRAHNQDGSLIANDLVNANSNYLSIAALTEPGGSLDDTLVQTNDEYVTEGLLPAGAVGRYIFDQDNPTTNIRVNTKAVYVPISPTDPEDLGNIALDAFDVSDFKQPTSTVTGGTLTSRDDLQKNLIDDNGTITELAFLDKAMMDGRQGMNVRVLELDIGKLTSDTPFDSGSVAWIPEESGIFYAAREDAVREDTIVRPRKATATWTICKVFENLIDNAQNCPMVLTPTQANQLGTYDPPLNEDNLISPKPVDMYPDPDRRPNGFRLLNGYNLNRTDDNQAAGMSFVTDNPAYIYGNFNLHQNKALPVDPTVADPAANLIEEFVGAGQLLGADFAALADEGDAEDLFYGRKDLDDRFARGDTDTWRSVEIFSDAITILSDNFRDGWIEDAFTFGIGGTKGVPLEVSSYLNSNRADRDAANSVDADRWLREDNDTTVQCDNAAGGTCELPIRFDRDGIPQKWRNTALGACIAGFNDYPLCSNDDFIDVLSTTNANVVKDARQKNQVTAPDNVRVNALMIAGIVPMRKDQTYGGIQNFPRLLEYWEDKNLIISGGFFQLNFSTQATAPQDQDAWEPGTDPISGQNFNPFYNPANRIWGYDVAFQYTSVAPVAQRFIRVGRPRSEYYREMPLDDPYIQNLCTALQDADPSIDSCD